MKGIHAGLRLSVRRLSGFLAKLLPLMFIGAFGLSSSGQVFTRVTNELSFPQTDAGAVVWFDYDRDGRSDVLICGGWGQGYGNRLFHNNQNGTFTQSAETNFAGMGAHTSWATVADFNDDGLLDVIADSSIVYPPPTLVDENPLIYLNQGNGRFKKVLLDRSAILGGIDSRAYTVSALDYNGDGLVDLALGRLGVPGGSFLLKNTGGALFSGIKNTDWTLQAGAYETISCVDYDGDGAPDLLGMGAGSPRLFRNAGTAGFLLVTNTLISSLPSICQAWGDFDNDGYMDVVVSRGGSGGKNLQLFLNDGAGNFKAGFSDAAFSTYVYCVDYDNDGWLDIFVTGLNSRCRLYRNLGGGNFAEVLNEPLVQDVFGRWPMAAWGDYNNDGFPDALVVATDSSNVLYSNSPNGNRWLKVKLAGNASNKAAIGAVVRVKAVIGGQELWQMRVVQAQSSFTEIVPHFGLGDATSVDLARIEWPSGTVQELTNLPMNTVYSVAEPVRITPLRPTASLGGSATLTSASAGTNYQWRFNGTNLEGQTDRSLSLTNLTAADEGRYSVVVALNSGTTQTNGVGLNIDAQFTKVTTGPHVTDLGATFTSGWGDSNGDGKPDLLVTRWSSGISQLYTNKGDGSFAAAIVFPRGGWGSGMIADFENNEWSDLFLGQDSAPSIFMWNEAGQSFSVSNSITLGTWWNAAAADFDRDGLLDLYFTSPNRLLRNRGGRVFQQLNSRDVGDIVFYTTFGGACWGDFDDDGWVDVYAADKAGNRNYLFRNQGGRFTQFTNTLTQTSMAALAGAWGDYDNDGRLDLAVACFGGSSLIYRNLPSGSGQFAPAEIGLTISGLYNSASWADYDNDGYLDLFMTYGNSGANSLFRNNGDGTFTRVTTGSLITEKPIDNAASYNGLWFDANGDGFLDLYVSNGNDTATATTANFFYLNNTNGNHWLQARLVGTTSNPQGIGAKVRAQAIIGGKLQWQRRDITSGDVMNGNNLHAHFGLGSATSVVTLKVEWPSGTVQQLTNVAADQILTITEPRRPTLSISLSSGGAIVRSLRADASRVYEIQASGDLLSWTVLTNLTTDAEGLGTWSDPGADTSSKRFYQARGL